MIFTQAGANFEAVIEHAPQGILGVIGVRLLDGQGNIVMARRTTGIIEEPTNSGRYVTTIAAPITEGQYGVLWDTDPGGVATPANSASQDVLVTEGASVSIIPTPPDGGPSLGPCIAWISSDDVAECAEAAGSDVADYTEAAVMASMILFELSGRQFAGGCQRTVRPCAEPCRCGFQILDRGHVIGVAWNGRYWRNDMGDSCGCGVLSRVKLAGYPITEVVAVKIDGTLLDPATYRLDGWRYLTRMADPTTRQSRAWPACQRLDLDDDQPGTFSITYSWGAAPPLLGQQAAIQLAAQLYQACHGGECNLPQGVVSIARQGITMTRKAADMIGKAGTNLTVVDSFLAAYNPTRKRRRPAIMSRDVQQFARKLGP